MVRELERRLNFKTDFVNPIDIWVFSKVDEATGLWNGQIGQLKHGQAEFALGDVLNAFWRPQVTRISHSYDSDYVTIASPLPKMVPRYEALVGPFGYSVWAALLLSLVLMPLVLVAGAYAEENSIHISRPDKE